MSTLRGSTQLYLSALVLTALAGTLSGLAAAPAPSAARLLLAVVLAAGIAVAHRYPLELGFKSKLLLDSSMIFVAVLVFTPGLAMLIAGCGVLAAGALRRQRDLIETAFNASQTVVQAGLGALLL